MVSRETARTGGMSDLTIQLAKPFLWLYSEAEVSRAGVRGRPPGREAREAWLRWPLCVSQRSLRGDLSADGLGYIAVIYLQTCIAAEVPQLAVSAPHQGGDGDVAI